MAQFSLTGEGGKSGEPDKHPLPVSFRLQSITAHTPPLGFFPHRRHSRIRDSLLSGEIFEGWLERQSAWITPNHKGLRMTEGFCFQGVFWSELLWSSLLPRDPCQPRGAEISSLCWSNDRTPKYPGKIVKTKQQRKDKVEWDALAQEHVWKVIESSRRLQACRESAGGCGSQENLRQVWTQWNFQKRKGNGWIYSMLVRPPWRRLGSVWMSHLVRGKGVSWMELLRLLVVGGGVVEGAGTEEEVSVMEEKGFRHEGVGVAEDCWLGRSFLFLFFFFLQHVGS